MRKIIRESSGLIVVLRFVYCLQVMWYCNQVRNQLDNIERETGRF